MLRMLRMNSRMGGVRGADGRESWGVLEGEGRRTPCAGRAVILTAVQGLRLACSEGAEGDLVVPGASGEGVCWERGEGRVCRGWGCGEWLVADCWCRRLGWGWHGAERFWSVVGSQGLVSSLSGPERFCEFHLPHLLHLFHLELRLEDEHGPATFPPEF